MRTILTPTIALYWLAVFSMEAVTAAGGPQGATALSATLATGHAVVAASFLWLATASFLAGRAADTGVEEVAASALAAAVIVTGVSLGLQGMFAAAVPLVESAALVAGLAASYVAVRLEHRLAREDDDGAMDYSPLVARRLAAGAAHGSMLARIAGRSADPAGSEA